MPARRQAIIWTNDGLFTDAYMGLKELILGNGIKHTHVFTFFPNNSSCKGLSSRSKVKVNIHPYLTCRLYKTQGATWVSTRPRLIGYWCNHGAKHGARERAHAIGCHRCRWRPRIMRRKDMRQLAIVSQITAIVLEAQKTQDTLFWDTATHMRANTSVTGMERCQKYCIKIWNKRN